MSQRGVFNDLAKEFIKNGHNVIIVSPMNSDSVEGINVESGIEVLRFRSDQLVGNTSMIKKGLAYLKLIYQYPRSIFKYYKDRKIDLIISHSLPPEIGVIVMILKAHFKCKFYLMLCEYIWQDSVSLGLFKKYSIACLYYRILEELAIKSADFIASPSPGNIDFVLKYHPWSVTKNIHVLHYCQSPIVINKASLNLKKKYNVEDKFIAVYGGNMSIAQKTEHVIDLAESCLEYDDIVFFLLGKGPNLDNIKADVRNRGIVNIRFVDFLPQDDYLQLLSICDVGLIVLNEKLGVPNIPSKTMSYFNLSLPIVASIDYVTDYGTYITGANAGLWSYSGDVCRFKSNLLHLYNSPEERKRIGKNAYDFYRNNMMPEKAYQTIIEQISK